MKLRQMLSIMAFLITVAGIASPAVVLAEGKITIKPIITGGIGYNSNYWLDEDDEVPVITYSLRPGVVVGYETAKTELVFDGTIDFWWYNAQEPPPPGFRDADDDSFVGTSLVGQFNHQLTDRLNIGVSDEFYITRDHGRIDQNSDSIDKDKYMLNYFEPNLYYEFDEDWGLLAKYRYTITDYEDEELEDSKEHRGIFDLYYNLNSVSAIYVDYTIWQRSYDQDSATYLSNFLSLNYERKYNYFTLSGGGGYHHRDFDDDLLDDLDIFSWKIQVRGKDPEESKMRSRSILNFDVGQELNNDGTGDQYFTATYVRLEGGYRFYERIGTYLTAQYQNSDYDTDERDEDTYLLVGKIVIQFTDYIFLGINGGFERRDANFEGNSYDDLFIGATLDLEYDYRNR